jgi:16S rRNA (guanine527-N7)-methyltransferase
MFHVKPEHQIALLSRRLQERGIELTPEQKGQFEGYLGKILQWNRRINLISKHDESRIAERHFLESIGALFVVEIEQGRRVLDLGTGAGLPGLPIKILRPDLQLVLLDSKRMKTLFLRDVIKSLDLVGIEVLHGRAEELGENPEYRGRFDWVISRAVAPLDRLWRWVCPLLEEKGRLLAIKGGDLQEELSRIKSIEVTVRNYPSCLLERNWDRKIVIVKPLGN